MTGAASKAERTVCPAVVVAVLLEELDHLRAGGTLPTPGALLGRLEARESDVNLVTGATLAYLRARQ
jgi:hypothetical protein